VLLRGFESRLLPGVIPDVPKKRCLLQRLFFGQ